MQPTYIKFENKSDDGVIEKVISNTKDINVCINNKDKKHLIHDLKNQDVFSWDKVKKANGEIKTSTFKRTNLNEYENTKLNSPKEIKLFNRPFNEKMLNDVFSNEITLFISLVRPAKHIFLFKMFSPSSLIEEEIRELIYNICSQIK